MRTRQERGFRCWASVSAIASWLAPGVGPGQARGGADAGIGTDTWATIIDTETFTLGTWHLVAVTWNGTTVTLYVDNRVAYTGAQNGAIPSANIWWGAMQSGGAPSNAISGGISDPQIRAYAMTSDMVVALYAFGRNP